MNSLKKSLSIVVAATFVALISFAWPHGALAASGSLYLTPSSQSVQNGNTFTVSLRVNPGSGIDTVTASVGYDTAKLSLVGVDCSGSPFTAFPSCPTSGNPVSITSSEYGGSVSTDSLVAKLTFKALVGTSSTTLSLSGNDATSGTANNPSVASASVSFTNPACAAGQTGVYPNCVTPPTNTGGGTTGTTGTKTPTTTTTTSTATTKTTTSKSTATSTGTSTTVVGTTSNTPSTAAITVTNRTVQYSQAVISVSSAQPTQVFVEYSTDHEHYTDTPVSDFGTTHDISLAGLLTPGETYYYVIVSKDQQGNTTQTDVQTMKTKGLSVKIGVFDKNQKPLRHKTVTLHSTASTGTTDDNGYVTFNDVSPGTHHVTYTAGKQTYSKEIAVTDTVQTTGTDQTASAQDVAVVLPLRASASVTSKLIPYLLILVIIGIGFGLFKARGRLQRAVVPATAPDIDTIVVSPPVTTPEPVDTADVSPAVAAQTPLNPGASPAQPSPGSTVTPASSDDDKTPTDPPESQA